jgi:predicted nucleic acid-binding protein
VIHLDTSFLIKALVPRSAEDVRLRGWLRDGVSLGISAIAWAEFLCGPVEEEQIELAAQVITDRTPLTEQEAVLAARLFNLAGRRRGSLVDSLIAASAIRQNASLATANPGDFRKFGPAGLEFAD